MGRFLASHDLASAFRQIGHRVELLAEARVGMEQAGNRRLVEDRDSADLDQAAVHAVAIRHHAQVGNRHRDRALLRIGLLHGKIAPEVDHGIAGRTRPQDLQFLVIEAAVGIQQLDPCRFGDASFGGGVLSGSAAASSAMASTGRPAAAQA